MVTFGVMDELATDSASVYTSTETQEIFKRFGIRHSVSSAYNSGGAGRRHLPAVAQQLVKN